MNKKRLGIFLAVLSAITYALNVLTLQSGLEQENMAALGNDVSYVGALISNVVFTVMAVAYIFIKKEGKLVLEVLKSKQGLLYILFQTVISPLSTIPLYRAIDSMGSVYTSMVTSLYPALGAVLGWAILHEKISGRGKLGIAVCVTAIALQGLGETPGTVKNLSMGLIFASVVVLAWALNTIVGGFVLTKKNVPESFILSVNGIVLSVVCTVVLLTRGVHHLNLGSIIASKAGFYMAVAGFNSMISCLTFYVAMNYASVTKVMCLNVTYVAWQALFEVIMGRPITVIMIVGALLLTAGTVMVTASKTEQVLS